VYNLLHLLLLLANGLLLLPFSLLERFPRIFLLRDNFILVLDRKKLL
jgi:hypothetical protein